MSLNSLRSPGLAALISSNLHSPFLPSTEPQGSPIDKVLLTDDLKVIEEVDEIDAAVVEDKVEDKVEEVEEKVEPKSEEPTRRRR